MYQTFLPLKTVGNIIISLNKHICSKCLLCTGPYLDGSRLGKKYFSWVSRRRKNWWLNMMVFSIKGMSKVVVFYNTTKFESLNCHFRKSSLLESLSNLQISLIIWFIFQEKKKSKSPKVFFFPLVQLQWQPTPVLLPGKSHGRRSLVGCRPWGR